MKHYGSLFFFIFKFWIIVAVQSYPESIRWGDLCPIKSKLNTCTFQDSYYLKNACKSNDFMFLVQQLITTERSFTDSCRRIGTNDISPEIEFDFIIVGAGVAGSVLAKRLSDNPEFQVLLVEAGPEEPSIAAVPALLSYAWGSDVDWKYKTEPTPGNATACLSSEGRCSWPRGKMVGGTANMNGMMYMRGHPEIFNQWEKFGNKGWSYAEIEKYYKRAENPISSDMKKFKIFDGVKINNGNPLIIDHFRHIPTFAYEILKAAEELNYKTQNVYPSEEPCVIRSPVLTYQGLRGTPARYYLRSDENKPNLYLLTNALVTKVLIDKFSNKSYGIRLRDKTNQVRRFFARKEVILSAGAIGSPHILLLSGIGPKEDLLKHKISVIQDLPVGKNLQNHVSVGIGTTINDTDYTTLTIKTLTEFIKNQTGPLSSTGLTQLTAFFNTSFTENGIPDVQTFFDGFGSGCTNTGMDNECSDGTVGNCSSRREIYFRLTGITTRSKGYLTLKSKYYNDNPLIYPNYFTVKRDLDILVEGIRKVLEFVNTTTMKKWDMRLDTTKNPACERFEFNHDDYWKCVIQTDTLAENHQVGTCKMGPNAIDSVVNPQLQIHNVSNLRVVDASIMPININTNPVGTIVMIAEKAADMIQEKYIYKWH